MALATTASSVTLPLGGAALSAPAAPPKGAYAFAVAMAKAKGHVSERLLCQALKVSPEQAAVLMQKLQDRGVVFASGPGGVSHTVDPMFRRGVAPGRVRLDHDASYARHNAWSLVAKQIKVATRAYCMA